MENMSGRNHTILNLDKFNLSCPFTWGLRKAFDQGRSASRDLSDFKFDDIPLINFIVCITSSYESIAIDKKEDLAYEWLEAAGIALKGIRKDKETSEGAKAAEHILQGTAMHIFHMTGRTNELNDMCEKFVKISELNEVEQAALEGCKSFTLLLCPKASLDEVLASSTKAIAGNGRNPLWHYARGHCFRKQRKFVFGPCELTSLELSSFTAAAECSTHAFYKIHYIQARHESWNSSRMSYFERRQFSLDQLKLLEEVLPNCGNQPLLLLRVVLGMLRCIRHISDFNIIHSILDRVDELSKDNSCSFAYRGRVYKHQGDYTKAMEYLERAAVSCNFAADFDYFHCMVELRKPTTDLIEFSMGMLEKYKDYYVERLQQILLNIVAVYYLDWDFKNCAQYMLKAIELSPDSQQLQTFHRVGSVCMSTAYDFLRYELLPKCSPENNKDDEFGECVRELRSYALKNVLRMRLARRGQN